MIRCDMNGRTSSEKAGKLIKNTFKNPKNLSPPSQFVKSSSGPDWTLCRADSGPQALFLTPLP